MCVGQTASKELRIYSNICIHNLLIYLTSVNDEFLGEYWPASQMAPDTVSNYNDNSRKQTGFGRRERGSGHLPASKTTCWDHIRLGGRKEAFDSPLAG